MAAVCNQLHIHSDEPIADSFIYELFFSWLQMANGLALYYTYTGFRTVCRFFHCVDYYRFLPKPIAFSIFLSVFEAMALAFSAPSSKMASNSSETNNASYLSWIGVK